MPRTLAAIKVKIGLRPNGHADHPNWGLLPSIRSDTEENTAADMRSHCPYGWHYDKQSGHQDDTPDSPFGQQYGMLLCSETFAAEAQATFSDLVTRLTEAEAQDFWDNKAHKHMPEETVQDSIIEGAKKEIELIKELLSDSALPDPSPVRTKLNSRRQVVRQRLRAMLDPDDPTPGVNKNPRKRWADWKGKHGITFKAS